MWRERSVVGIGLVNKDFVAQVPAWERDQKAVASAYFEQVGGPVPVALAAVARLGIETPPVFLSVVGADKDGDDLAALLTEDGVDTSLLTRSTESATSKSLVILDERDGSRTLANWAGGLTTMTLATEQQKAVWNAGIVHLDGRDLPASLHAACLAQENGGLISIDLGTMRPGRDELLSLCDIVLASRKGAAGAFPKIPDLMEQAKRFLEIGATVAGVTLGQEGVVIASREINGGEPVHLRAFAIEDVKDTCGAGDTFHGAFLWAYRAGFDAVRAADFAQAAVALRIQQQGNRAGLPTRTAVEAFLASSPARH